MASNIALFLKFPLPLPRCSSQGRKEAHRLDQERTKAMVELFAAQPTIGKIFIEPHLKTRLHLNSPKIRFHSCKAARHDDHVHVQIE
jgi:murein endopeptidase